MARQIVYLAGGINGLSDEDAKGWRDRIKPALAAKGYLVSDPMDRDYRGAEDENIEKIVLGDKQDIQQADVLFAYAPQPSWGTAMEIHFAWNLKRVESGRRIYVVVPPGTRISPWLRLHADAIFEGTPGEAVEALL